MDGVTMVTPILLVGMVMVLSIVMWAIPVRLWVEALSAGVTVSIGTLIGMRLRKVSPAAIVRPLINATKAGLDLDINALEAHYLAGGRVDRVVGALISADKASIELASMTSDRDGPCRARPRSPDPDRIRFACSRRTGMPSRTGCTC